LLALAAETKRVASDSADPLLLVLPSDHVIVDEPAFQAAVQAAIPPATEGYLVTFGIVPDRPETGYGYLLRGREQGGTAQFIIDGLLDGGMEENQFETIYSEPEAIAAAMLQMKDNDLVVILADHVSESLDAVRQYSSGMK
jgi:mannose-1-phosphate guanylyltransferase